MSNLINPFWGAGVEGLPFICKFKTDNPGDSDDFTITLPLVFGGTFDFNVQWGDGNDDDITTTSASHTYGSIDTYELTITGTLNGWGFQGWDDNEKIIEISQWGILGLWLGGFQFFGCKKLLFTATDIPIMPMPATMSSTFRDCDIATDIPNIEQWDWSNTTKMDALFFSSPLLNPTVNGMDVSGCTRMDSAFRTTAFNGALDQWEPISATNLADFLLGENIGTTNYDALLIAWSALSLQSGVTALDSSTILSLNADIMVSGENYQIETSNAVKGKEILINTYSWSITDGGGI